MAVNRARRALRVRRRWRCSRLATRLLLLLLVRWRRARLGLWRHMSAMWRRHREHLQLQLQQRQLLRIIRGPRPRRPRALQLLHRRPPRRRRRPAAAAAAFRR